MWQLSTYSKETAARSEEEDTVHVFQLNGT